MHKWSSQPTEIAWQQAKDFTWKGKRAEGGMHVESERVPNMAYEGNHFFKPVAGKFSAFLCKKVAFLLKSAFE